MPTLEIADASLHYEITGNGAPLLLIPGLGQTCRTWDPIVPILAEHYSVIQVDNRGIGDSVAKRPALSLGDHSSDFVELLDAFQIDQAHVMGISFGGVLAQRFSSDHPQRVDRLVLVSTTNRSHPYLRSMAALLGHAIRRFPLEMYFRTVELLGNSPQFFDAHEAEIMAALPMHLNDRLTRAVLTRQLHCLSTATCASVERIITAPTLVIAGEYDALIPNCYGKELASELPDARFVLIDGCGHNPIIERPDLLASLVIQFLQEARPSHKAGTEFATK